MVNFELLWEMDPLTADSFCLGVDLFHFHHVIRTKISRFHSTRVSPYIMNKHNHKMIIHLISLAFPSRERATRTPSIVQWAYFLFEYFVFKLLCLMLFSACIVSEHTAATINNNHHAHTANTLARRRALQEVEEKKSHKKTGTIETIAEREKESNNVLRAIRILVWAVGTCALAQPCLRDIKKNTAKIHCTPFPTETHSTWMRCFPFLCPLLMP